MHIRRNHKIYDPSCAVPDHVERELDLALTHAPIQLDGEKSNSFAVFKLKHNQLEDQEVLAGVFGNTRLGKPEAAPLTAPLVYLYCCLCLKTTHHWHHIGICSGMQLERANSLEQPASMIGCKFDHVYTLEFLNRFNKWLHSKFPDVDTTKQYGPVVTLCVGTPSSEYYYQPYTDIALKNGSTITVDTHANKRGSRPKYYL